MKIKKQKVQKCIRKRKLKFEDYKNCLKGAQTEKSFKNSFKEDHKAFIRNNKLILKAQQRFRSEKHNAFTEKINKIALSSNDEKRMQSIDSIETHAHGTSKNLVCETEEIKW